MEFGALWLCRHLKYTYGKVPIPSVTPIKEWNIGVIAASMENNWKGDLVHVFFIEAYIDVFRHDMPYLDWILVSFR